MNHRESGASLAEFLIAAPIVLLVGMATLQAGLIYHGKTTLNYATFEAARTGAVNNAQLSSIRLELGQRLAPVQGGDGSQAQLIASLAESVIDVNDPTTTLVQILNPTPAAFDDWGVMSLAANKRVLPNTHLRHKSHEVGFSSGVSLRDANLLKVRVVYGLDMKVPVIGEIIAQAMTQIDSDNAHYYRQLKFPINAVATVRMQSEAWEDEILAARAPTSAPNTVETASEQAGQSSTDTPFTEPGEGEENEIASGGPADDTQTAADLANPLCEGGEFGLGTLSELIDTGTYDSDHCSVASGAYSPIEALNPAEDTQTSDCA